ncbi:MAG: SufD family Fe-S cluster assembly protein [Acholeplasmataceae bacterium]|nr:SufD family Fe-S cluster assembly protein [Acholeplasmataceae bacterium]
MDHIVIKNQQLQTQLPSTFLYENNTLTIPKNQVYREPLIIQILDEKSDGFHIVVSANTQIKIIVEIQSDYANKTAYHLSLEAKENSHVKYLLVSELESNQALIAHNFSAAKDATLDLVGGFVSHILDAKMHVDLLGEGAEVLLRSVAISSDENIQNIDVLITHKAPHTHGDMTNIGIANKKGKIILNGIEKIEKGMKNANAFQTLKGIITSDQASIDVNPILLIDEYDIKAGHGATIGKIEEEQMYYLQSRGLTKEDAERLIINGFLQPVVDEIDDESLKERFVNLVNSRI